MKEIKKKYNWALQQQTRSSKRNNFWTWRQVFQNIPVKRYFKIFQSRGGKTVKKKKKKESLQNLWDTIKWTNICIIGLLEKEEIEKVIEKLFIKIQLKTSKVLGEISTSRSRKLQGFYIILYICIIYIIYMYM